MKTIVIIGSARWFGYALAIKWYQRRKFKKAKEKLEKIESKGIVAKVICNVTDIEQINNFYQRAQELFSSVDIWTNNAGVNQPDKAVYELTKIKLIF